MPNKRVQRVRDPVHGLIVFDDRSPLDVLAWKLIQTAEFQRLRRIKQLGVSEFVYPGATHTRFAHSVGVFNNARLLARIIKRELGRERQQNREFEKFNLRRAQVAIVAALLHDLGHGPFSHTFEEVQKTRGIRKRHEKWTAEIVRSLSGQVWSLLEEFRAGFGEDVARLLESDDPIDIYHAIVSSSFDADRLDYLQRDRLMTGSGAGAIDFAWLMEQVRVRAVSLDPADADTDGEGGGGPRVLTFCLDFKALPAAEQFLLARYTLHEQVYFHKTTRCVEHMIAELLKLVAAKVGRRSTVAAQTGLPKDHPVLRFFANGGATVENYLALDDVVVTAAFEAMRSAKDAAIAELASRLVERKLYKTLDIRIFGSDSGVLISRTRRIDRMVTEGTFEGKVLKDTGAGLSIYSHIGGDEEKAHKKLRILDGAGAPKEISSPEMSKLIGSLAERRALTRYYFENESDRESARNCGRER